MLHLTWIYLVIFTLYVNGIRCCSSHLLNTMYTTAVFNQTAYSLNHFQTMAMADATSEDYSRTRLEYMFLNVVPFSP